MEPRKVKIKLYDKSIVIDIPSESRYINFIYSRVEKFYNISWEKEDKIILQTSSGEYRKIQLFLTSIYYLCAYRVQYENPIFYSKLIKSAQKKIIINILRKKEDLKKYYKILNISAQSDLCANQIRQKYLQLAKIYHPDHSLNQNPQVTKEYTEKFLQIKEAYEILKSSIGENAA